MVSYFKSLLVSLMVVVFIETVWLVMVANNFYYIFIGHLMNGGINWITQFFLSIIFSCALVYFVVNPAIKDNDFKKLLTSSVLLGLIAYGTYDLTNFSTLRDWPLNITVIDMIWGICLTVLTAIISYFILKQN